jgi:hypothetical protein
MIVLTATVTSLIGWVGGCSGPDEPKLAEAPPFTTPPDPNPPKIPDRKTAEPYGASSKYQEAMERAAGVR